MPARETKARANELPNLWLPAAAILVGAALTIAVAHGQTTRPDSTGPQTAVPRAAGERARRRSGRQLA